MHVFKGGVDRGVTVYGIFNTFCLFKYKIR